MDIKNVFSSNLKNLIKRNDITQTTLARQTGISLSSLNNYIQGINFPSVEFLIKLKEIYGINIDNILTTKTVDLQKHSKVGDSGLKEFSMDRYEGSFILYFYVSSGYKGSGYNPLKDELRYGVMSIYPLTTTHLKKNSKMDVSISLFKKRSDAEDFKTQVDKFSDAKEIKRNHEHNEKHYFGDFDLTSAHVFISVKSSDNKDRLYIIFNSPPTDRQYIGGIGTVNSISTGREPSPVIQYILMSRNILDMPDGEIYNLLNLPLDNFDITTETVGLINQFKELYLDKKINLEDFEKKYIMQNNIEKVIRDVIRRNVFRYAKVSNREDDKYYRISVAYKKDSKK